MIYGKLQPLELETSSLVESSRVEGVLIRNYINHIWRGM